VFILLCLDVWAESPSPQDERGLFPLPRKGCDGFVHTPQGFLPLSFFFFLGVGNFLLTRSRFSVFSLSLNVGIFPPFSPPPLSSNIFTTRDSTSPPSARKVRDQPPLSPLPLPRSGSPATDFPFHPFQNSFSSEVYPHGIQGHPPSRKIIAPSFPPPSSCYPLVAFSFLRMFWKGRTSFFFHG